MPWPRDKSFLHLVAGWRARGSFTNSDVISYTPTAEIKPCQKVGFYDQEERGWCGAVSHKEQNLA